MPQNVNTRVTLDTIEAITYAKRIDASNAYSRSERGFNTAMRVASDRPSKLVRLRDGSTPGMFVAFQRVAADGITYKQRVANAVPLKPRRPDGCVWSDVGSTFEATKSRSRTPDISGMTIAEALGLV